MSDLVKRLRDDVWGGGGVMTSLMRESADKIEQLERELAELRHDQTEWMAAIEQANKNGQGYAALQAQLAAEKAMVNQLASDLGTALSERDAEKALADAFYPEANQRYIAQDACAAYRKARGME